MDLNNQSVLVTGGTGSFGQKFVELVLRKYKPKRLIVFSRDELKQQEMRTLFPDSPNSPMRYFIGDVRDRERLERAFYEVDIVIHAAALKQVPACEYNPFEAIQTNIIGAKNVIDAAIDQRVKKVVAISTDKAVNPVNLYGASKLCAEKLFVQGNAYAGATGTRFSCCRYGNVVGSRGSVVPLFLEQRKTGTVTITDRRMTRFWITLEQGTEFVLQCLFRMCGGEIFVPKIPSMKMTDVAASLAPDCQLQETGIRSGEKLHELLLSEDEARHSVEVENTYIIVPQQPWWGEPTWNGARPLTTGFSYGSNTNSEWLTPQQFSKLVNAKIETPAVHAGD